MKRSACIGFAVALCFASPAGAQEIVLQNPLAAPPPTYWVGAVPAELEWTYWVSGGIVTGLGDSPDAVGAVGAIGFELTSELLRYHGFPSGYYGKQRGDAEIRVGPWVSAATRASGGLVEGGLKLHLGGIYHASFGTWDARLGAGYGAYTLDRSAHVTATLAYGVRGVLSRHPRERAQSWSETPPAPRALAEATVARIFVTLRQAFQLDETRELVVGVELSPTFLLPPYSWLRFGGGPPW
jgi:hypothetical protein